MQTVAMIVWNDFKNDARVLKEAQTLQAAGYQVIVHALHTPGVTQEYETLESGVKVVRVMRSPFWNKRQNKSQEQSNVNQNPYINKVGIKKFFWIASRIWTHLLLLMKMLQAKPDVIHAHDVNTLPTAYLASIFARAPLVYDAHEVSTGREGYHSFRKIVYYTEKFLMPKAKATITTTTTRAKFFARAYHIQRPIVLQNRPRLTSPQKTNKIRDELNLHENWPIVLYQGGLQQGRGLERLLDAASKVPNTYFVYIGGGRLETLLKDKAKALHLENKVYFIPTVSLAILPLYTASADMGVQVLENTCFNHYSTDSNKLFEYIIAGLPIIATHFPEIAKVIRQYDLGMLIPPGNTDALITALRTLSADPTVRKHYHHNAASASKNLNWEEQEQALIDLYTKLPIHKS